MNRRLLPIWLVVVLTAACGGLPSGDATTGPLPDDPTSTTTTAPAPPSTADPTVPDEAPPASEASEELAAAARSFEAWIGHIAAGDEEAAWDDLAPTSQSAVGRPLFSELMTAMSEGWAAWSRAEDVAYSMSTDDAGRTLLQVSGTVTREGMTETTENVIPIVWDGYEVFMSPFEEFGNVAEGIERELAGEEAPALPEASGEGRRVVYSNAAQRVWLVDGGGTTVDSYLVSGKQGVPALGTYEVFSRSETAFAGHDDITMRYMVRFAHGDELPIGFHSIPNDASGRPLQSEDQLGAYRSAGCVRQSLKKAAFLYEWATEGTQVVVMA